MTDDIFDATAITEDGRSLIYQVVLKITESLQDEFKGCSYIDGRVPTHEEMAAMAEEFASAFFKAARR